MHETQKNLIGRLIYDNHQRYSKLTRGYNADDNILFHLGSLIKRDFIRKRDNLYHLTKKGLEFSGRLNLNSLKEERFKTPYLEFLCKCDKEVILRERVSNENQFYKFPGSKPLYGESMEGVRQRLFMQATGLEIDDSQFKYLCTHFRLLKTSKGETLFDDVLIVYEVYIKQSERDKMNLRKYNKWFPLEEIKKLEGKWPEIDIILFDNPNNTISEYEFVNDYNLEDL